MRSYQYPAAFVPAEEGGFVITFRDVPEAISQGESIEECIEQATDSLDEAIIGRINDGEDIPAPSEREPGEYLIPVPPQTALKAALYEEIRNRNLSKVALAALLGIDEREVRRMLDPHHRSKLLRIADVLERVGKRIVVQVEDEKEMVASASK